MEKSNIEETPKTDTPKASLKTSKKSNKGTKIKAKLLNTYYGHPLKDMKLICITGTAGKVEVAHYVYEILKAAGHPVDSWPPKITLSSEPYINSCPTPGKPARTTSS